ncbi:laccase-like multicopper oxidase [Glonium stellatum]|uniref:Laccase-like multicopper oxidase n=1 Tax=Glonium stellatum TaxID=574774 RepID=A0A8E2JRG2_9PEZI|nr:laccase-like multicopper oxidase [Glonium stellatum]
MKFIDGCRTFLLYLEAFFSSAPSYETFDPQHPLNPASVEFSPESLGYEHPPKFNAPQGPRVHPFVCKYPSLGKEWTGCTTSENRTCWLKGPNGREYNIHTNYEIDFPEGITREYYLELDKMTINGDGIDNTEGKVFNQTYPGPWIQACWGDIIKITVKNNLRYNGTTIHWHGIRQLGTMEMDGVNGVTQCPIAPADNYTYTFRAMQYGTTWYHSHYSLQYGDGALGPMTIYGPSSASYDEGRYPIMMTDWNHRSAFQDFQGELTGPIPRMNSVLINGMGNFAGAFSGLPKFNMSVEKGKKYLLRIINTAVDTTYLFSIDNHNFTVMTADFVPIHPYSVDHILVGIGQRYHVVLDANATGKISNDGNYWIRAVPADGCKGFETGNEPDERQGILRYNASSTSIPTTSRRAFSKACRDEEYGRLKPILPWNVTEIPHGIPKGQDTFDVGRVDTTGKPKKTDSFVRWALGDVPLWLDFANPTINNLGNTTFNPDYVVINEDYPENAWIYLLITAPPSPLTKDPVPKPGKGFVTVAHPIHLHGHDFALLAQSSQPYNKSVPLNLTYVNPPRRDVALLPAGGYLVIAFKADNPGAWLMHCHIAWHASSGLALQILERQNVVAAQMTPSRLAEVNRVCDNWKLWFNNPENHYNKTDFEAFQDDSGI